MRRPQQVGLIDGEKLLGEIGLRKKGAGPRSDMREVRNFLGYDRRHGGAEVERQVLDESEANAARLLASLASPAVVPGEMHRLKARPDEDGAQRRRQQHFEKSEAGS